MRYDVILIDSTSKYLIFDKFTACRQTKVVLIYSLCRTWHFEPKCQVVNSSIKMKKFVSV